MKKKSYALIVRSSPYGSRHGKDALDMVLALSAFEQNILLVFEGDGVAHITAIQGDHAMLKAYAKEWAALPLYDVNNIAVVEEDYLPLEQPTNDNSFAFRLAPRSSIANDIAHCDIVLRF